MLRGLRCPDGMLSFWSPPHLHFTHVHKLLDALCVRRHEQEEGVDEVLRLGLQHLIESVATGWGFSLQGWTVVVCVVHQAGH